MGQIIKGKIYLEYVANIFTEKKLSKNLSEEKKILRGKNQLKLTSQVLLSIKTVDK